MCHYFPPETPGGTQAYVAELAGLQREAGRAVALIAGSREPAPGGAEQAGMRVWRLLRDLPEESLSGELGCARLGGELERLARAFLLEAPGRLLAMRAAPHRARELCLHAQALEQHYAAAAG